MLHESKSAESVAGTRLPCLVFPCGDALARHAALAIAHVIRERNSLGQKAVLGLAADSMAIGVYGELVRQHREENLSFADVVAFNLDEFLGLHHDQLQSRARWMHEHFFDHVNLPAGQRHRLDGTIAESAAAEHCREYEAAIQAAGGIDVMLLGLGHGGQLGFNEPFSDPAGRTYLCTLDPAARLAAAGDFFGEPHVPLQALTMGLGTIRQSRKILLLALSEQKGEDVRQTAEGEPTPRLPASLLQQHGDATLLLDHAAAGLLTDRATPWLRGDVEWTEPLIKRALLWLCRQENKALLMLDDKDFQRHDLHSLLRRHGPAPELAHRVFRWMLDTIEYHPAGKVSPDRPPRRVLCFSPHPDDDVISMGGTLIRLIADGHEVHVAYMTSGNIAVFDHDAARIADLVTEYNQLFDIDRERSAAVEAAVLDSLRNKRPGDPDSLAVQQIKSLIRRGEAKAGAAAVGCREDRLHFLDLPFYQTGTVRKRPLGDLDIRRIRELFDLVAPQQIYVAGDLSDPHGTHRVCAHAIFRALREIRAAGGALPEVLLYRGAWQEYALHEIELAVPLSPCDLDRKRQAIFMHESQKDEALFPGSDPREFWQRAEDRNKKTAREYNQVGLPEFFALEAFVRWDGETDL